MRMIIAVAALAACSPSSSGQAPQAPQPDAPPGPPVTLVQRADSGPVDGSIVTLPIAPTGTGDLLLVGLVTPQVDLFVEATITTDAGDVSALAWSTAQDCGATISLWEVEWAKAGATSITVDVHSTTTFEAHALEFAGGPEMHESADGHGNGVGSTAAAPALPAAPGQLVVSELATCSSIASLAPGDPFTAVANTGQTALAYLLPSAAGSDGAVWSFGGGAWRAHTYLFN